VVSDEQLPEISDEAWDVLATFLSAHQKMHPVYGSTAACGGGVGGQALTAHCVELCHNPVHRPEIERYESAYYQLRRMLEQNRRRRA
jgi:hypothetical protein